MVDKSVLQLVNFFLEDEPELKADTAFAESLAQEIQTCIEDSISLRKVELRQEARERNQERAQ